MNSILSRKHLSFLLILLLSVITLFLLLPKINSIRPTKNENYHADLLKTMKKTDSFSEFSNALFCHEITSDSVTTAYTLKNPAAFQIPKLTPQLSSFSYKQYAKEKKEHSDTKLLSALSDKLEHFDTSTLKEDEYLAYTLLKRELSLNEVLSEYAYYDDLLGSTTGVQASLPVTLGEYPLRTEEDIKTYLTLLTQIPDYFENVISYEEHRKSLGFKTPDFALNAAKENLSTLIKGLKKENNSFTDTFNSRLSGIKGISKKQRKTYQNTNRTYVQKYVLPAYENLYEYINQSLTKNTSKKNNNSTSENSSYSINKEYLPDADTPYGMSTLPDGATYYSLLVKRATGSDRSVEELISMTESSLKQALGTVLNIALTDQKAYLYYTEHPVTSPYHSPEAILEALSLMGRTDYPALKTPPAYKVKSVPESLAPSLSPAFYMIPAMDDYKNNSIYINPLYTSKENNNLFTTLAHEGFPGHLYQTVYFNETNPLPVRHILNYAGFVEGWATYTELNSFSYIEYPLEGDSLLKLYQADTLINLALCSRVDLGVNYENWTLNDVNAFFEKNGFKNYYTAELYSYVVEAPSNYLSYFIGYLEIMDLKEHCKKQLMENYSEKEFHKLLLDIGPSDFTTLRSQVSERAFE